MAEKVRIYHSELGRALEVVPSAARVMAGSGWRPAADTEPAPEPPPADALKAEWVDWAVERGIDRETAESMTKADLQNLDL